VVRALVTGATGLIGNRIAAQLVGAGHPVRVLARDPERAAAGTEWVFHTAGMPEQWQPDPGVFDRVNRQGTRNVLEAALAAGTRRVMHTSTMDVFAPDAGGRLTEALVDPHPKHTACERSKQAAGREAEALRVRGPLAFVLWNARVDATKARRELDYSPMPLAEGLGRTLGSFRQQRLI